MRLDSVGVEIYDIHGYFYRLTIGQLTLRFWGVTEIVQTDVLLSQQRNIVEGDNEFIHNEDIDDV